MTTVNSRLVNLRRPASSTVYPLNDYIYDTEVIPIDVFDSLEEAMSFLIRNHGGTVSFPRKSLYNDYKYPVHMKGTPNSVGVVELNIRTYGDHYPVSKNDTRPVHGDEWLKGDVVYNIDSNSEFAPISWVCIEQGMPGVWSAQGFVTNNYGKVLTSDTLPDANELHEGQIVLHHISNELSELCYCAEVADGVYEWKSILAYETAFPPDEEDTYDKFLAYGLPLVAMEEFTKPEGPDQKRIDDLRDRLVTAEDLAEYDRLQYKKEPSYTEPSIYIDEIVIEPSYDLNDYTTGIWYCPYDFAAYPPNTVKPMNYPPTDHPIVLRCKQFTRIANDVTEVVVLQKATDVMTGETYSRCGRLADDRFYREMANNTDSSLYDWHQNGNATPIADLTELLEIIDQNMSTP